MDACPERWRTRDRMLAMLIVATMSLAGGCLSQPAALTQLLDARRRASEMHVALTHSTESANRAVMAKDDAAAGAAAAEARDAMALVDRHVQALRTTLADLNYEGDLAVLNGFATGFAEYRRLTDEVLALALDRTNLKAEQLSFGPAAEASEAFRAALDAALRGVPGTDGCAARERAWRAYAALLEVRALHARHIAEPGDAEMDAWRRRWQRLPGTHGGHSTNCVECA